MPDPIYYLFQLGSRAEEIALKSYARPERAFPKIIVMAIMLIFPAVVLFLPNVMKG